MTDSTERTGKIALLSPYGGANLGDQAIQFSFVGNLRSRCPDLPLIGLTLDPPRTAQIHGIPCYPLTGMEIEFYSTGLFVRSRPAGMRTTAAVPALPGERAAARASLRARLRRLQPLADCVRGARRVHHALRNALRELRYLAFAWRLAGELRLLIVAGGGQLDDEWGGPWGHPYVLARWALLCKLRGVRVAFVSVGSCRLGRRLSRTLIGAALRLAQFRSYRDEGSKRALDHWAFTHGDHCFPDAAFGLVGAGASAAARSSAAAIGVSPIAFGRPESWPTHAAEVYSRYIQALAEVVIELLGRGERVLLFITSGADIVAVNEILERVASQRPELRRLIEVHPAPNVQALQVLLLQTRAVIASRLHGVMLSHLSLVPVLAVSFDRKVDAHMADMGMSEYCTDIRVAECSDLLRRLRDLLARESEVAACIGARVHERAERMQQQFDLIARMAGHTMRTAPWPQESGSG